MVIYFSDFNSIFVHRSRVIERQGGKVCLTPIALSADGLITDGLSPHALSSDRLRINELTEIENSLTIFFY